MSFTNKTDNLEKIYEGFYEDDSINKRFKTKDKRAAAIRKDFKSDLLALVKKMNKKYPGFFEDTDNNVVYALSEVVAEVSMRSTGR